jgi:hypothetical protein
MDVYKYTVLLYLLLSKLFLGKRLALLIIPSNFLVFTKRVSCSKHDFLLLITIYKLHENRHQLSLMKGLSGS